MKRSLDECILLTRQFIEHHALRELTESVFEEGTCCLVDKPSGWTSFDVVNKIRFACRAKRVGHSGTLDPFATGLLLVCTGRATKTLHQLTGFEKNYSGCIRFGARTTTDDCEGDILEAHPLPGPLGIEDIQTFFNRFVGHIEQVPPVFSAVRVDGVRAYRKARQGDAFIPPSRSVFVSEFFATEINWPDVSFRVACSKGTYIRSLARDLGNQLGCGAHLLNLRRTAIGEYKVEDALGPQELCKWIRQ